MRILLQITCLIVITLVLGCASSHSELLAGVGADRPAAIGERGDYAPRQIEDAPPPMPYSPVFWVPPLPLKFREIASSEITAPPEPVAVNRSTEGYRIQVYSGKESATARRIFAQIKTITGLEAYLNYEAPQYKVRVGDFSNRDDANQLLLQIRRQGFPEAWVVRSTVVLSK